MQEPSSQLNVRVEAGRILIELIDPDLNPSYPRVGPGTLALPHARAAIQALQQAVATVESQRAPASDPA